MADIGAEVLAGRVWEGSISFTRKKWVVVE
jgi:hypothetical protein